MTLDLEELAVAVATAMRLHEHPAQGRPSDPRLARVHRLIAEVAVKQRREAAALALGRCWASLAMGDDRAALDAALTALEDYCEGTPPTPDEGDHREHGARDGQVDRG